MGRNIRQKSLPETVSGLPRCLCGQSKNTTVPLSDIEAGWWHIIGRPKLFSFHMLTFSSVFNYPNQALVSLYSRFGISVNIINWFPCCHVVCLSFLCNSLTQTNCKWYWGIFTLQCVGILLKTIGSRLMFYYLLVPPSLFLCQNANTVVLSLLKKTWKQHGGR